MEGARECGLHHESIDDASAVGHLSGASNEHVEGLDRTITLICKGVSAAAEMALDILTSIGNKVRVVYPVASLSTPRHYIMKGGRVT